MLKKIGNKVFFRKLKLRLLNRGTLLALVAFLVKQGLAYGYIPTQEVADSIVTVADWVTTGLIALGVINNASIGTGFGDKPAENVTFLGSGERWQHTQITKLDRDLAERGLG
ncbi:MULTISPECIES: hypothetical protein [Bacillus cereus group]|uniref:hypothetical protein n=1 Tax=Bacillus cereus group TaxID=86661 RepID=UPI0015964395|nr:MULTISPECIES: hypothetical protein [Bacillus cereus group]